MDVIIITSSLNGTASVITPMIFENAESYIKGIIYNRGVIKSKKKFYSRKLKKLRKTGILGAFNGIRMRDWYKGYNDSESIEDYASRKGIPFFVTDSINCNETIRLMKDSNAEIGLSLGNSYISKKVFTVPKYGMINIHHEILPDYQGAQSIIWQIFNNSRNSGFTIHNINERIDDGNILAIEEVPIKFQRSLRLTVEYNYRELIHKSGLKLINVLNNFHHFNANSTKQSKGVYYTTPSFWQFIRIWLNYRKLKQL